MDKFFVAPSVVRVLEISPDGPGVTEASKTKYTLKNSHFFSETKIGIPKSRRRKDHPEPYLIIGFDTEYKVPDEKLNRTDIRAGNAKYRVLSYQFHCLNEAGLSCSGICCPDGNDRITLGEFLSFALGKYGQLQNIGQIPPRIYLVGHFTRADMPAFADFANYNSVISAVRNTFISIDQHIKVRFKLEDDETFELKVFLRDTMLLTPGSSTKLAALGDIVERPKMLLDEDPAIDDHMKSNMDIVRRDHWELFRDYALNDAVICAEYLNRISKQNKDATGGNKIPVTLTGIGVELLLQSWERDLGIDPLKALGQEIHKRETWDKRLGRYKQEKTKVPIAQCHWHEAFVTETYHGGRNEQFWFGPAYEATWTDYDLSSAYPTAMSLIGKPDWENVRCTRDPSEFTPTTLGFACVDFKFPPNVRYPTLPVRTNNGLIFPLEGRSNCAAPEVYLALQLGAEIKILHGIVVPADQDIRIFGAFIKDCIERRSRYPKKSLDALFWKEISNSTYGKTAQGLREKRVYDNRERKMQTLPKSRITNPFFASFITSFVRAVLGEIMNAFPPDVMVFSCTTDGFLTDASEDHIVATEAMPLASIFKAGRDWLTGTPSVLEKKHEIRMPLGWRTRGQATLVPGPLNDHDTTYHVVLARAGISLPDDVNGAEAQSKHVCDLFFKRLPDATNSGSVSTGIRDIIEFDADLVTLETEKRLSMEFDWKRRPHAVGAHPKYQDHVIFSTRAWDTVEQFITIREQWVEVQKKTPFCMKTVADLSRFSSYLQSVTSLATKDSKYLSSTSPDIVRLRQTLCSAWHGRNVGITGPISVRSKRKRYSTVATAEDFASALNACGIPTKISDVTNGKKKPFVANRCPATSRALASVEQLRSYFPNINPDTIFSPNPRMIVLKPSGATTCHFISLAMSAS